MSDSHCYLCLEKPPSLTNETTGFLSSAASSSLFLSHFFPSLSPIQSLFPAQFLSMCCFSPRADSSFHVHVPSAGPVEDWCCLASITLWAVARL